MSSTEAIVTVCLQRSKRAVEQERGTALAGTQMHKACICPRAAIKHNALRACSAQWTLQYDRTPKAWNRGHSMHGKAQALEVSHVIFLTVTPWHTTIAPFATQ